MADNDTLTPAQRRLIAALLTERDVRAAAKTANVAERTAWRWMEEPEFKAELTRQEGAVMDQITRGLLTLQADALSELSDLMTNSAVPAAVRLQAVKTALDVNLKYRELNTLEARIAALEAAQNGKDQEAA